MKLKYLNIFLLGVSLAGFTSCNDFLDKEPESSVTPAAYFTAEADLAAYSINLYNFFTCIAPGSYGISVFGMITQQTIRLQLVIPLVGCRVNGR